MFRILAIVSLGIAYSVVIATNSDVVNVNSNDPEVKAAIEYAFGKNSTQKDIILTEGTKRSNPQVVYKLRVTINYYSHCADNETNIWVVKTERGCKTTSFCQTEIIKQNNASEPFRSEQLQCIA